MNLVFGGCGNYIGARVLGYYFCCSVDQMFHCVPLLFYMLGAIYLFSRGSVIFSVINLFWF